LRDLVSLGKVRIEVVLSSPLGLRIDLAVQSQRRLHSHHHSHPVQHRERSGQAQAHRACIHVRWLTKACGAGTKELGIREELSVTLQANHSFVLRIHATYDCSIFPASLRLDRKWT